MLNLCPRSTRRLPTRLLLACACSLWITGHLAHAQSTPLLDPAAPLVPIENKPTRIESLNLNIYLPKGSVAETTTFGTTATVGIGLPDQLGIMVIKEQRTNDPELTASAVTDNIIKQLTRSPGSRIISRISNLEIRPNLCERFYIFIPGRDNKPDSVRGMTIVQSQPRKFLIFDFTSKFKDFEQAKLYYETSVGTIDLGNPADSDTRRSAAIKSMLHFLDTRSIEDYQRAMTNKKDRWERLYMPAASGDEMDATEYGYRKIRSWGGFKGELSEKPRSSWTNEDRKLGYFVQIDAMAIEDDIRVDTRATFYMSEDTKEESWTIKMSLRRDGVEQTSTITGARSGDSMAIILDQSSSLDPIKTHPLIQGDGYISQVQTYLVSALLAQNADPGEYASYAYNSSIGAIALRWDLVERPEETPDLTRVTTKVSADSPPNVSIYDKDGKLLRVRLSNERIWEPIELNRLIKLWEKKGLPLE